jgi:predicted CXXCH cytochrome family protein
MKRLPVLLLLAATTARAGFGSVVGSKHDLSVTGPGPIRALTETNACAFCHLPHSGNSSRPDVADVHRPYESGTMHARVGRPTGATRICLSCHDGTIAVGQTKGGPIATNISAIPADHPANLGTDLRKTHPVSFRALVSAETQPPPAHDAVRLDRRGEVQCTSCHDPHFEGGDPLHGKFLVKPSQRSALCLTCHLPGAVQPAGASHATSGASFGPTEGNTEQWASVNEAGCMACHVSHGADTKGQLVTRPGDDDDALCLRCHRSGGVARQPVGNELLKASAHATSRIPGGVPGVHDAGEGRPGSARKLPEASPGARRHVVCVDCHDPHAANDRPAVAPGVSGALAGVWGLDLNGQRVPQVRFEYELCFKCHADSANKPQSMGPLAPETARRARNDVNLRQVFASSAASAHPVLAPGRSADVPGLVPPLTATSLVTCGDCHASDSGPGAGGGGPRGPHGSIYPHLLERNYTTTYPTAESPTAYALCYKCHRSDVLFAPPTTAATALQHSGFWTGATPTGGDHVSLHALHVRDRSTPCSACHNAHGISSSAGTPAQNGHLVDFDVSIVTPGPDGLLRYQSLGPGSGSCNLSCHGVQHSERDATLPGRYSPAGAAAPAAFRALRSAVRR